MPPRHGKSELTSHYGPVWFLNTWPTRRIILCSYEASFAASWGRKTRNTIQEHEDVLDIKMSDDSASSSIWELASGGGLITAGVGGAITGRGADLLVIDDPVKNAEEANSETYREKVWEWFTSTAYTRLEPGAAIILVMTRWHEDDLAGRLLAGKNEGDEHWREIRLPAIAEDDDLIGRDEGEPLWPWRYDAPALERIKRRLQHWWSAIYQQRPTPIEGGIIKSDWWQYYDELPPAKRLIVAWDTAFKIGRGNDYSVGAVWAECKNGYYLIDLERDKLEFPELVLAVKRVHERHRRKPLHLVEDAASGQSLIQVMRRNVIGDDVPLEDIDDMIVPIRAVKVSTDKITRVSAVTHLIEGGRVYLPAGADWLTDFLYEHSHFPNAPHDDIVDTTSMALAYLAKLQHGLGAIISGTKKESVWMG